MKWKKKEKKKKCHKTKLCAWSPRTRLPRTTPQEGRGVGRMGGWSFIERNKNKNVFPFWTDKKKKIKWHGPSADWTCVWRPVWSSASIQLFAAWSLFDLFFFLCKWFLCAIFFVCLFSSCPSAPLLLILVQRTQNFDIRKNNTSWLLFL